MDTSTHKTLLRGGVEYAVRHEIKEKKLDIFLAAVRPDENGCWIWQKGRDRIGRYGSSSIGGITTGAHRVAYHIFKAPVITGYDVHHICKVPLCVNPDHLEMLSANEHAEVEAAARHKDVCKNGHDLTPENVYGDGTGRRIKYRKCRSEYHRRHIEKVGRKRDPNVCRRGHPYTDENVYWYQGRRYCRKCHSENTNRYYHAAQAKKQAAVSGN